MNELNYQQLCLAVCEVAQQTGEYIARERAGFSFDQVQFKGAQNMVSYVDQQAERLIVRQLQALLPQAGFITEEGTLRQARHESLKWVVDPLDGTTNFIHGLPPYCVSIALMQGSEVVVGVVHEITLRETFYAWKGSAAYLNHQPIAPSATQKLENALIAIGFSYNTNSEVNDFLETIAYFQTHTHGIRRIGSAAADLVYVACGRFDAFSQVKLAPWDVAAGALIARQSGAIVSDFSGGEGFVFGMEIIASTPAIYTEFKAHML